MLAVAHHQFKEINLEDLKNYNCVLYDIKGMMKGENIGRL